MEKYSTHKKPIRTKEDDGLTDLALTFGMIVAAPFVLPLVWWAMKASDKQRIERTEKWNAENVPGWKEMNHDNT